MEALFRIFSLLLTCCACLGQHVIQQGFFQTRLGGGAAGTPTYVNCGSGAGHGGATLSTAALSVSGVNRLLLFGIVVDGATITSVVWDPSGANQAMTLKGSQSFGSSGTEAIYALTAPTASASAVARVTLSGTPTLCVFIASSWSGVNQTTPLGAVATTAYATNTSENITVTSAATDIVNVFWGGEDASVGTENSSASPSPLLDPASNYPCKNAETTIFLYPYGFTAGAPSTAVTVTSNQSAGHGAIGVAIKGL